MSSRNQNHASSERMTYTYDDEEPERLEHMPRRWNGFTKSSTRQELMDYFMGEGVPGWMARRELNKEFSARALQHRAGQRAPGPSAFEQGQRGRKRSNPRAQSPPPRRRSPSPAPRRGRTPPPRARTPPSRRKAPSPAPQRRAPSPSLPNGGRFRDAGYPKFYRNWILQTIETQTRKSPTEAESYLDRLYATEFAKNFNFDECIWYRGVLVELIKTTPGRPMPTEAAKLVIDAMLERDYDPSQGQRNNSPGASQYQRRRSPSPRARRRSPSPPTRRRSPSPARWGRARSPSYSQYPSSNAFEDGFMSGHQFGGRSPSPRRRGRSPSPSSFRFQRSPSPRRRRGSTSGPRAPTSTLRAMKLPKMYRSWILDVYTVGGQSVSEVTKSLDRKYVAEVARDQDFDENDFYRRTLIHALRQTGVARPTNEAVRMIDEGLQATFDDAQRDAKFDLRQWGDW